MAYYLSPIGNEQAFDVNGAPASGYKLFTYVSGSSTKQTTYTDSTGGTPNANPIIMDSAGFPASGSTRVSIWLTGGVSYKFVYTTAGDTDPPTTPLWTKDVIAGINDTSITISEWISGPTPTYVANNQFTLVGDQTTTFHVNRALKLTLNASTVYDYISAVSFGGGLTTVTTGGTSLTNPVSAVAYGIISAVNSSAPNNLIKTNTNNIISGTQTFTGGIVYTSTDAGATAGPSFDLYRDSASPAVADLIGEIQFNGRDSATNKQLYANIISVINDPTSTSEDGKLQIYTTIAGTATLEAEIAGGLILGSPTGSFKGAGTVNAASGVYDNGNRVLRTVTPPAAQTIPAAGATMTFAHGLGAIPSLFTAVLVAGSAPEHGYTAGQEVSFLNSSVNVESPATSADATNVYVEFGGFTISSRTTHLTVVPTPNDATKWQVKVRAWA